MMRDSIVRLSMLLSLGLFLSCPVPLSAGEESRSSDRLRERIRELKVRDVVWREIPWTSCLLDGLRKARREKKPLLLWVFIDRPVDDTRC